jgi:hypothetical protein
MCRACYQKSWDKAHPDTRSAYRKVWNKENPDYIKSWRKENRDSARKTALWRLYRLTPEDWEKVNEYQKFVCAISGRPPGKTRLYTDHDHKTGLFRGLLSMKVNRGMAYFNDDPVLLRKAAEYLENPPAVTALGKKVFGLIGKAQSKKKMIYGSENGPIKVVKKVRNDNV